VFALGLTLERWELCGSRETVVSMPGVRYFAPTPIASASLGRIRERAWQTERDAQGNMNFSVSVCLYNPAGWAKSPEVLIQGPSVLTQLTARGYLFGTYAGDFYIKRGSPTRRSFWLRDRHRCSHSIPACFHCTRFSPPSAGAKSNGRGTASKRAIQYLESLT
jgi:hypothetical protein